MNSTGAARMSVIRADDRHFWANEWLRSSQSFPATGNFDLVGNAHGVLLVNNDDVVNAGEGLDMHQHRDTEIITWVVAGSLRHRDSHGNEGILRPGMVQRMSAGTGITHAEGNASTRRENSTLRVVQMWVAPEFAGGEPSYAEGDFTDELATGGLVQVVSGRTRGASDTALPMHNPYAVLHAARPRASTTLRLPAARFGHLYVVAGSVQVAGDGQPEPLTEGDALRTTDAGDLNLIALTDSEILYWEMHTSFDDHV